MDFNASEIVLLLVLALILFGPEKLPDLARKTARVLHYVRRIANDAQGRLRAELGPEYADLQLSDLNPKAFVAKHLGPESTAAVSSVGAEIRDASAQLDAVVTESPGAVSPVPAVPAAAVDSGPPPFDPEAT